MKKNCIIFGAGFYGKAAFYKLSQFYQVQCYVDNNSEIWGNDLNGIKIISPEELSRVYDNETDLWICCRPYMEIFGDLRKRGISQCYAMVEGFAYFLDRTMTPYPISIQEKTVYHKSDKGEKNILFVQNTACIRTHKIAAVMKKNGWKVFLLYTIAPPSYNVFQYDCAYDQIFTCFTAAEVEEFVNESEFDIIHSSNEPDILTSILVGTNKKIVFDTHDMMSLSGYSSIEVLMLEYIASTRSDGLIHVAEEYYEISKKKYPIQNKPYLCIGNYPQYQYSIKNKLTKLHELDGEIHCVYEGGMVFSDKNNARYFGEIWKPFLEQGIHIHFYTGADKFECKAYENTSRYLHYEGSKGTLELIEEMTKYDFGLMIFNINDYNRALYENSSQNKRFEYINSGLPIATRGVKSNQQFVEKYHVGLEIDMEKNLVEQIEQLMKFKIEKNFLADNRLTMESMSKEIEDFYEKVISE